MFSRSKTIGKAILGLEVVSSDRGEPVGFWKMLFREWIVKRASASVVCLGYLWVVIDDKNRGWHDKILDTYVVDLKESELLNIPVNRSQSEGPAKRSPQPQRKQQPMITSGPVSAAEQASRPGVTLNAAKPVQAEAAIKTADETVPAYKDIPVDDFEVSELSPDTDTCLDYVRWWYSEWEDCRYIFLPSTADRSSLMVNYVADEEIRLSGVTLVSGEMTSLLGEADEFDITVGDTEIGRAHV